MTSGCPSVGGNFTSSMGVHEFYGRRSTGCAGLECQHLERCGADPTAWSAVDMPLGAERPAIIVGQVRHGGAAEELVEARRASADGRAPASGLGAIDCNHPLALGLVVCAGHYQANHATRARLTCCWRWECGSDDRTSSSIPVIFRYHSVDETDLRRYRSGRDRPQLSGRARLDGRRATFLR